MQLTVRLIKQHKAPVEYPGVLLRHSATEVLVHARWQQPELVLPYVTFCPGDHFFEHYSRRWWLNVHEVRGADGRLKGWYCNSCRPMRLADGVLESEDLELDLFVTPERAQLVLDEAEFAALPLEPAERALALAHFAQLRRWAAGGAPPFNGSDSLLSLALGAAADGAG